jgi:epoxide hydrolase-like predicted phosphatase
MQCVIFDIGGVLVESPTPSVIDYEQECQLPKYSLIKAMEYGNDDGITAQFERNDISFNEYVNSIEERVRNIHHGNNTKFSGKELIYRIERFCVIRQRVLDAIDKIRSHGVTCAVITNNWYAVYQENTTTTERLDEEFYSQLKQHFDVFVQSRDCGYRKPSIEIYNLCFKLCEEHRQQRIPRDKIIFCDDIGRNLKPLRDIGVNTIRVESEQQLLMSLQTYFDFSLCK